MDTLISFPHRMDLSMQVKVLNGLNNGGLKRLERFINCLSCTNSSLHDLNEVKEAAVQARHKARLPLACRSACLIIRQNRLQDIEALKNSAR